MTTSSQDRDRVSLTDSNRWQRKFIRRLVGNGSSIKQMTNASIENWDYLKSRLTPRRLLLTLGVLTFLLIAFGLFAISIGSEHVGLGSIVKVIAAEVTRTIPRVSGEERIIVAEIRFPRVLMGLIVGAALAVAGAAYQALLRNPLADPGILGVSSGAALGAIAATIFAESLPVSRPIAAFVGAGATI